MYPLLIAVALTVLALLFATLYVIGRPSARASVWRPGRRRVPATPARTSARLRGLALIALLAGMAAGLLAAPPVQAQAEAPPATVNTGRLNVRAGPGVNYSVLTRLADGTTVALLGRNTAATWVRIRLASGLEGWVNASYLRATVVIGDLPVSNVTTTPAPSPASAVVTAAHLEVRAGPGPQHPLVATLGQGQSLNLVGRTPDSAWVKVRSGTAEGWVVAQVTVILPGNENGTAAAPFSAGLAVSSLPIVEGAGAPPPAGSPRVSLSSSTVRPATPVFINVAGFPPNRDLSAVLTSRSVPVGFVVATGRTDGSGGAQLFFRQPETWPSGPAISEAALSLAVGTPDGAVLVWCGLTYHP